MSRINLRHQGITIEDIIKATEQYDAMIEADTFDSSRDANTYHLHYEDRTYPPKFIAELAYNLKHTEDPIGPKKHSSDIDIRMLKDLGFEVKEIVTNDIFTWIPYFMELGTKLQEYRNNQHFLIELLSEAISKELKDENPKGVKKPIEEIDPFSFFAQILAYGEPKRIISFEVLKEKLQLKSKIPSDFAGVPTAQKQKSWLFAWEYDRNPNDIAVLWDIYEECIDNNLSANSWREALAVKNTALAKLTEGLFWLRPNDFFPLDGTTKPFLFRAGLNTAIGTLDEYELLLENISKKFPGKTFAELSYDAWMDKGASKVFDDDETRYEAPLTEVNYYWLNANPKYWSFSSLDVGDEQSYYTRNEKGNKRRLYECFESIKPGDLVIGYEATPTKRVVAHCQVTEGLHENENGDDIVTFKILDYFVNQPTWEELKGDEALQDSGIIRNNHGSLFPLKPKEYLRIIELTKPIKMNSYDMDDALEDLFIEEADLQRTINLLNYKKNIILQGPTGVGKTFVADRLAFLQMREKDKSRLETVQFHQSYSYEDFIQGYRPKEDGGFELVNGSFYRFCKRAQVDCERDYFFIIDEINRGNLSKIFGELMMLIEYDKRGPGKAITLTYTSKDAKKFYIPENVYVIGTMNTADRSLSIVDYALRRRFAFVDIKPSFNASFEKFLKQGGVKSAMVSTIIDKISILNREIENDTNLGTGFTIGHSYFCNFNGIDDNQVWYEQIIENEIGPMLYEYWFDNVEKAKKEIELLLV